MRFLSLLALLVSLPVSGLFGQELEREFQQTVKPFLAKHCYACHGASNPAAQFNLRQYTDLAGVVRDHARWALVAEKLHSGEMPPKPLPVPPAEESAAVAKWVETLRRTEAAKNAGDPGMVLARRLNNAEYNNSIRDLTGVDLKPAREFPVDPSNSDGFDNSGESLSMSPALLNKYLQAAREVSTHLVMGPAGIRFAPHPMLVETDREKYTIQRIVEFYDRQPTDYADYFVAAWTYKHRAALSKPEATMESIAAEAKISPRYLPLVWEMLEGSEDELGPVARLRTMWRRLPVPPKHSKELLRESAVKMRDYVVKMRTLTAAQYRSPRVKGLAGTSQPLMNWKLRAYAAHRRDFDRGALQMEGEPPLVLPAMPRMTGVPSEDEVAVRNLALAVRARAGEPELFVPAGQRAAYEAAFARFSNVFPDAFYIRERGRFYPDDSEDKGRLLSAGFHNVMGYFRDDTPLQELILDEAGRKELDLLWLEFDTVADFTTRTYVQFFFNQSGEVEGRGRESGSFRPGDAAVTSEKVIFEIRDTYLAKAEKDGDELSREAIREHFARVNAMIRKVEKARLDAEPIHLAAALDFAERAWRRPLREGERAEFTAYYKKLREGSGLSHEDAMRDLVVLALMAPEFCYRVDVAPAVVSQVRPAAGPRRAAKPMAVKAPAVKERFVPLGAYAVASRLSYLLWSSMPDAGLREAAGAGKLDDAAGLAAEARRMLADPKARALAVEFAGNWLDFRRFEDHNSVDRTRFPQFTNELREAMFEEPVRFMEDLIRNDRPVLEILYGKHTYVNRVLANHYGIQDFRTRRGEWTRIENARPYGRGGMLTMAAFLTRNSPGLRTSPVKRGYWVAKTLLGEQIPPPPPGVPELPSDESKTEKPLRQVLAAHRANAACAGCHARFDGFGLAFEGYGPVGEQRTADLAGRPVDSTADFPGGGHGKSPEDLIAYIKDKREKDFLDNLCRKFLAYSLGRGLQLSDELLLASMQERFAASGYKFSALVESVVTSPQFRTHRRGD